MNTRFFLYCAGAALALALPSSHVRSQAVAPADPVAALQALETANEDLLKRQDDTSQDLTDMTATAQEIRLYVSRG